ncbi:MAG: MBL fold metallo-hydrolase [Oscillospiraceae bacterium]|nr:MBL fold metallo-hydrolase [Oscillospiraceae bacterium]
MRKLACFAAPFCCGVFLAQLLLPESLWPWAALTALLLLGGSLFLRAGWKRQARLALAGLTIAFAWCTVYRLAFYAPAEAVIGTEGPYTATVLDYPVESAFGVRLPVSLEMDRAPVTALLYLNQEAEALEPGDRLTGSGKFYSAVRVQGKDVTWYTAKGIFLRIYGEEDWSVEPGAANGPDVWYAKLARRLETVAGQVMDPEQAGFVSALLTGNRAGLTDEFTTSLSRTGLSHVVAVSGMHMTFLVGLLTLPVGRQRRLSLWCVPVLILFAGAAGFTPSITRAVIMQIIILLAPALSRENDPPTTLSFALFLLLAWNPYAAASIGLQLSFASVAGIFVVSRQVYDWLSPKICHRTGKERLGPLGDLLISSFSTTVGAMAFTTPLVAYYFEVVSIIAPLANLLVLWAVSILFGLGMLMALLGCLWLPLAQLLAPPASALAVYVEEMANWLSRLSFAAFSTRSVHLSAWVLALLVTVITLCLSRLLRRYWAVPAAALALGFCMALLFARQEAYAGVFNVTALDVGQGQCVLAYTKEGTAAIDCGGSSLDDPGDLLADRLLDLGKDELDLLVLTHFHTDHANGVEALFRRITVKTLALPDVDEESGLRKAILDAAEEQGTEILWITDDETAEIGGMTLRLYAPLGAGERNEEGLSVLCSVGENDLLVTGDMTAEIERRLVKYGDLPQVEVLMAGHHGSKYATGEALLAAVRPENVFISVGYNSYGHPAPEVLDRAAEADIYRTDLQGDLTIQFFSCFS